MTHKNERTQTQRLSVDWCVALNNVNDEGDGLPTRKGVFAQKTASMRVHMAPCECGG
jgi:hypothetical protein